MAAYCAASIVHVGIHDITTVSFLIKSRRLNGLGDSQYGSSETRPCGLA